MKNQSGFTLVEVIIATMLLGMVFLTAFPFLSTGNKMIKREQAKTEAYVIGNIEFDRIASELQTARQIFLGTQEKLEAIYDDIGKWECLHLELPTCADDMTVEVEVEEDHWIYLTVVLIDEDTVIYTREEMVSLLNAAFYKNESMEGDGSVIYTVSDQREGLDEVRIWYQNVEE